MKKVLDAQRFRLLAKNREDEGVRDGDLMTAFDAIDTELSNFLAKLESDAGKIERAAAKLPQTGKMMAVFAGMLRDYGDRLRGEAKEERRIIVPGEFNGANGS